MCKHPAGLVQGIRGPPAPTVEFLLNAPTALIQGVASEVHDVEGVHDRPRAGEFFGGCALKPGESIHRDGACLIVCVSVFCLKGLMHDE